MYKKKLINHSTKSFAVERHSWTMKKQNRPRAKEKGKRNTVIGFPFITGKKKLNKS